MDIAIHFDRHVASGEITLPASKSISNRVLLINALSGSTMPIRNLADCDDTAVMSKILHSDSTCFNVGHAGTAMRFLTAYLSQTAGKWEITGSERMKERPIAVLADALNRLGADITYKGKEGFPPLSIRGAFLQGGKIEIPASVSSQYISALMMIAPYMKEGLTLNLTGKIVSQAYIRMTASLMRVFGAVVEMEGHEIKIMPVPYKPVPYSVEADWSAASYFYEWLAIRKEGKICLPGLLEESLQGDARQVEVWEKLGVMTRFEAEGVQLVAGNVAVPYLEFDFTEMPDLVQSFAVACCLKGIPFSFSGVETLRIKETDRIAALVEETSRLGFRLKAEGNGTLSWDGSRCAKEIEKGINTYHDHRMAMAFAPAAWKFPGLIIRDKDVVTKSFPKYWEELGKLGLVYSESCMSIHK